MPVTPAIIAVELGRTAPESGSALEEQWAMWIADATRAIERRAELLSITFDSLVTDDVDYVVRQAVAAHVRRPDDATQVTISVDDGSTSKTYSSGSGRVGILEDWWALLGLTIATDRAAYSVPLGSPWYQP